ncbi:hypothetical protein E2C01_051429 [Portunus trituberculatus]|uniref:Uncharacterized protein n=1 Tax=Portunus trituberculatus TaxID=210409 RepID=A0A5B7GIV7_PORTR|nr:hypothetical protein [Portunus trituberculatus]
MERLDPLDHVAPGQLGARAGVTGTQSDKRRHSFLPSFREPLSLLRGPRLSLSWASESARGQGRDKPDLPLTSMQTRKRHRPVRHKVRI